MNIVLIGYRGTGKSHVGRLLSKRLSYPYESIDKAITVRAGISIPEIVERYGWPGFRDLESLEVRELSARDSIVIDTGGGIIEHPENIEQLRLNGCIFWLKASVATIVDRIKGNNDRPSLTAGKTFTEEVSEVLERRTPLYAGASMYEIDTDNREPGEIADTVTEIFLKRAGSL